MSKFHGRMAMDQITGRPVLVSQTYAGGGLGFSPEVTSGSMTADIRELSAAVQTDEIVATVDRNRLMASSYGFDQIDDAKPFVFSNGYALIPIHGFLMNRFSYSWGFATGYNFIRNQVAMAAADDDVKAIIFDVNSCGGGVPGCQETADIIYAARGDQGGKPLIAVVDANCHSAAYFLASQCDHLVITPSGSCANIGVLMVHFDVSEMMNELGVKVTYITAGAHKVDGNQYEPLPDDVRAEFQAEINSTYDTFVAAVVRGRGLDDSVVRETEARAYGASDALALGLVDAIQNPSDAVEAYFNSCEDEDDDVGDDPDAEPPETTENKMAVIKPGTPAVKAAAETPTPEVTSDTAVADARVAERTRISGITGHAEAVGREALANHLALGTDMDVETAAGILAASPKTPAPVAADPKPVETQKVVEKTHFEQAMDNGKHPNLGAGGEGGDKDDDGKLTPSARILRDQTAATGYKSPVVTRH